MRLISNRFRESDDLVFGKSLHLDMTGANKEWIDDETIVEDYLYSLVDELDMRFEGKPKIKNYVGKDETTAGITALGMLTTSSMSVHFVPLTGKIYLDFFSCKDHISTYKAFRVSQQYFGVQDYQSCYLVR